MPGEVGSTDRFNAQRKATFVIFVRMNAAPVSQTVPPVLLWLIEKPSLFIPISIKKTLG